MSERELKLEQALAFGIGVVCNAPEIGETIPVNMWIDSMRLFLEQAHEAMYWNGAIPHTDPPPSEALPTPEDFNPLYFGRAK